MKNSSSVGYWRVPVRVFVLLYSNYLNWFFNKKLKFHVLPGTTGNVRCDIIIKYRVRFVLKEYKYIWNMPCAKNDENTEALERRVYGRKPGPREIHFFSRKSKKSTFSRGARVWFCLSWRITRKNIAKNSFFWANRTLNAYRKRTLL